MLNMKIFNQGGMHVVWERDKSDPPSPYMGSMPHVLNQSTINQQKDNLLYGTPGHTMT